MLEITEKAQEMLNQYISQGDDSDVSVRIEIVGRGASGFNYDLQLVVITHSQNDLWKVIYDNHIVGF